MFLVGSFIQDSLIKKHKQMGTARSGFYMVMFLLENLKRTKELKERSLGCSLTKLTLYLKSNLMNKRE
jgi:hypothetical protein